MTALSLSVLSDTSANLTITMNETIPLIIVTGIAIAVLMLGFVVVALDGIFAKRARKQ